MPQQTILIVDDENDNVEALERIFRLKYKVLKATSGQQALRVLDQHPEPVALIITDQRMPEMTGVEFLARTIESRPETVRILLTGYTDIESVISAVNSGQIYRYLTKPWDPVDLQATVDRAVERYLLGVELKEKNAALGKALTELQTLDQAKTQFMILINHELKTPLTSILSFADLLSETRLNEDQTLCVSRIKKSSNRLKNLIDDVLLIVGGETKTLKVRTQPFEASQILPALAPELAALMKQKNQSLKFSALEKRVVGDVTLLQQVVHRLIHNAAKFGKDQSEISLTSTLLSPHRVRWTIENKGGAISQSVIDKVLQPFFIDEDVMNHSTGMGLGLTICQTLLKLHQSQLHIENKPTGVSVSFDLPCL
jgi:signal transduction histidine kinase